MRRLIILFCLLFSTLLHAQNFFHNYNTQPEITDSTGSLLIIVMDSDDSTPLIGANIKINKLQDFGVSNQYGSCVINNLKDGKYIVSCAYLGYDSSYDTVDIQAGRFNYLSVKMGHEPFNYERHNSVYYENPYFFISFSLLNNKEEFINWVNHRSVLYDSKYKFRWGDVLVPIVLVTKHDSNQGDNPEFLYSLKIIAPNNELFYFNSGLKPWYNEDFQTTSPQDILIEIETEDENLLGEYRILITIFDKAANQTITMTSFFELVDPNTY